MRISKRLELLSKEVKGYSTICDVGCDHGLFSIYSIIENNINHAYLLDINESPLTTARNNFIKYKLNNATFVLSDGLKNFNDQFDCLVISGVGGYLMVKILNDSLDKVINAKKLILQPNSDFEIVRKFLLENKFTINFENMIIDNKKFCYYLTAIYKETSYVLEDVKYGPIMRKNKNDTYVDFYQKKYNILSNEINNVTDDLKKNELLNDLESIKINILELND